MRFFYWINYSILILVYRQAFSDDGEFMYCSKTKTLPMIQNLTIPDLPVTTVSVIQGGVTLDYLLLTCNSCFTYSMIEYFDLFKVLTANTF